MVERNRAEFKAQFGSFEEAEIGPYWLSTSEDGAWLAFQSHRPDGSIHRFALPASMVPQFIVELAGATDEMNERRLAAALVAAEAKGGSLMPLLGVRLKRAWQRDQAGWSRPTDTASLAERSEYARILNASNRAAAKGVTARKANVTAMKTDGMQIIPPGSKQTDSMMCPLMASSTLY